MVKSPPFVMGERRGRAKSRYQAGEHVVAVFAESGEDRFAQRDLTAGSGWSQDIGKYLPATAGQAVTTVSPDPASSLPPWAGLGVFCLYAAVLLGLAAIRMRRGDA